MLKVKDLHVTFKMSNRNILAVRGVSFSIKKGKTLGIVGESGCGKSVTAFSILNLISPPGVIEKGEILYKDKDILKMNPKEIEKIRGKEIAMIFQEPMSSLNPVFSIGYQISESLILHMGMSKKEAKEHSIDLLNQVGIPDPHKKFNSYPHEFSGGMRQRTMIAIALSASPSILIADEPTTALDVTIQAQILDLLLKIQEKRDMSLILITHDLGIIANIADEIAIMYAGEIVEQGELNEIFNHPKHPYTKGLFNSIPEIGKNMDKLYTIPGQVPALYQEPDKCTFYDRCEKKNIQCEKKNIELLEISDNHKVRCIL